MRKNPAIVCLLLAWLCANGSMCDVAQIFAWARMFAGYARVLPVGEALTETFDATKPCDLCLAVQKARTTEQNQRHDATLVTTEKLLLVCSLPAPAVFSPPASAWPDAAPWLAPLRTEAVPVPPPRV